MMHRLARIRGLIAQVRPLLVYPLVQGEVSWMLGLLLDATEDLVMAFPDLPRVSQPEFMSIADYDALVEKWHILNYGGRLPDQVRTWGKVNEEFRELEAELAAANPDPDKVAEEAADVVGVLFNLCRSHGRQLSLAMCRKLHIIFKRLEDPSFGRDGRPVEFPPFGDRENPLSPSWCGPGKGVSDADSGGTGGPGAVHQGQADPQHGPAANPDDGRDAAGGDR